MKPLHLVAGALLSVVALAIVAGTLGTESSGPGPSEADGTEPTADALVARGWARVGQGDYIGAVAHLAEALELDPY